MSDDDKILLQRAGLSISEAARILKVEPQAVSQGLRRKKDYFGGDRLSRLCRGVLERSPEDAKRLQSYLRELRPTVGNELARARLDIAELDIDDAAHRYKSPETWVITPEPHELSDQSFLEQMMGSYFGNPAKTIVYFVPPEAARSLRGRLMLALKQVRQNKGEGATANIEVVECPAAGLTPHFAILDPRGSKDGSGPKGFLILGGSTVRIPDDQLMQIMNTFFANGIGVDPERVLSAPTVEKDDDSQARVSETGWARLRFRSIFSSREISGEDAG